MWTETQGEQERRSDEMGNGPGLGGPILTVGQGPATLSPSPSLLNSLMTAMCLRAVGLGLDHLTVTQEVSCPHSPRRPPVPPQPRGSGSQTTFLPSPPGLLLPHPLHRRSAPPSTGLAERPHCFGLKTLVQALVDQKGEMHKREALPPRKNSLGTRRGWGGVRGWGVEQAAAL